MTEDSGKARGILAVLLLVLLVGVNVLLVVFTPTDDFTKAQLNTLNGALLIQFGIVMAFYFGTSSGAKTLSAAQSETAKAVVSIATGTGGGNAINNAAPTGTPGDPVAVTEVPKVDQVVAAPLPGEDPRLATFRASMKAAKPDITDADVMTAWHLLYPPEDVGIGTK